MEAIAPSSLVPTCLPVSLRLNLVSSFLCSPLLMTCLSCCPWELPVTVKCSTPHVPFIHPCLSVKQPMESVRQSVFIPLPSHMPFVHPCLPLKLFPEPVCQSCPKSPLYWACFVLPCLCCQLLKEPVRLCHSVTVEVAYAESLEIRSGPGPINMGFLDTMNGSATLASKGKGITVNGLDGTAHLKSHGGPIQVRANQNLILYNLTHLFMALPWLTYAFTLGVRSEMTAT